MAEGDKTGVFTGRHAINPATDRQVPIYMADYVLMGYGTGAIMAVPGQDQRDWDFATKYGIDIIRTVQPPDEFDGEAYLGDGPTVNSGFLDGLEMEAAKERIIVWLEERGIGERTVNYRLRDWLITRQRYWGCPIPMVSVAECGLVPVPEAQLPVMLPDIQDYLPEGRSPLAAAEDWVNTTCPSCGGPAQRETDTMDTFVDRSWYFLRFTDDPATTIAASSIRRTPDTGCRSTSTSAGSSTPCSICSMPASSPRCSSTWACRRLRSRSLACSPRG